MSDRFRHLPIRIPDLLSCEATIADSGLLPKRNGRRPTMAHEACGGIRLFAASRGLLQFCTNGPMGTACNSQHFCTSVASSSGSECDWNTASGACRSLKLGRRLGESVDFGHVVGQNDFHRVNSPLGDTFNEELSNHLAQTTFTRFRSSTSALPDIA